MSAFKVYFNLIQPTGVDTAWLPKKKREKGELVSKQRKKTFSYLKHFEVAQNIVYILRWRRTK